MRLGAARDAGGLGWIERVTDGSASPAAMRKRDANVERTSQSLHRAGSKAVEAPSIKTNETNGDSPCESLSSAESFPPQIDLLASYEKARKLA
jgi:hypothetical protein